MGKKNQRSKKVKEEKVQETKEEKKEKKQEDPKISLDAFISMKKHSWPVKARLEHAVTVYKLSHENTVKEWEEILKKFA